MATITPHALAAEARPIPLRDVEAELARRVRALQQPGEPPPLRARMSNLMIYCDSPARADAIAEQVPALAQVHPARVLLLVAEPAARPLTATVAVRERSAGAGRTTAIEWVTLRAGGPEVDRLPYAVRPLLLGNLPVNLWWAAEVPASTAGPLLDELAEDAEQVLYDNAGWADPARVLAATAAWVEGFERLPGAGQPGWRIVTDLNWRRLRPWRLLLAQALDPASAPGALETITELAIEHGPHAAVQGWLLAGWLASRLGWRLIDGTVVSGSRSAWRFAATQGEVRVQIDRLTNCPAELQRVRVACLLDGRPGTLAFAPEGGCLLSVCRDTPGCVPRTVSLTPEPLPVLVGRQLSDRERDPIARASLDVAGAMARCLVP